jgi:hypothetical protein
VSLKKDQQTSLMGLTTYLAMSMVDFIEINNKGEPHTMKCPKCNHEYKDEDRAKGGRNSKRKITPAQQAEMQAKRKQNRK